jgi:hypothetical protein
MYIKDHDNNIFYNTDGFPIDIEHRSTHQRIYQSHSLFS